MILNLIYIWWKLIRINLELIWKLIKLFRNELNWNLFRNEPDNKSSALSSGRNIRWVSPSVYFAPCKLGGLDGLIN